MLRSEQIIIHLFFLSSKQGEQAAKADHKFQTPEQTHQSSSKE
jgi:hypothetical protein